MADNSLNEVRAALKAGDKPEARRLLRPILKDAPTADAWVLAARVAPTREGAIASLRKALDIDPFHGDANRYLSRLEGDKPAQEPSFKSEGRPADPVDPQTLTVKQVVVRRRPGCVRGCLTRLGCMVLLSLPGWVMIVTLLGLVGGLITNATVLTGGPTPISVINDVPIDNVSGVPLNVPASRTLPIGGTLPSTALLDTGYIHDYTFQAWEGEVVNVLVMFANVTRERVARNVVVVTPDNRRANCIGQRPLDQIDAPIPLEAYVVYQCLVERSGIWKVRILGRSNETVGGYMVAVQKLDAETTILPPQ